MDISWMIILLFELFWMFLDLFLKILLIADFINEYII